jgi:hypothetical protein
MTVVMICGDYCNSGRDYYDHGGRGDVIDGGGICGKQEFCLILFILIMMVLDGSFISAKSKNKVLCANIP